MSNLIEAAPEEPGNGSDGSNRAFVLIALGLASLLVIGLLLIFGYVAGSRLGFFGLRALASPDASVLASGPAGTATAVALAGATSASPGTRLPAAATSAAFAGSTRVPGATLSSQAAAGATIANAAATGNPAAATPTPTRVVGGPVSTPAAASTNALASGVPAAVNTPARGAVTPTNSAGGVISGGAAGATATTTGPGNGSSLPGTGVELDILIVGVLMVILLVIARGFRLVLRS